MLKGIGPSTLYKNASSIYIATMTQERRFADEEDTSFTGKLPKRHSLKAEASEEITDRRSGYHAYLKSKHWQVRKNVYFDYNPKICVICETAANVEVHHLLYDNFGYERDEDLVALCRRDHQGFHFKYGAHGDMRAETMRYIKSERRRLGIDRLGEQPRPNAPSQLANIVDKSARPIWKLIDIVLMRK